VWLRRLATSWYRITDLCFGLIKQFFIAVRRHWWWRVTPAHAIASSRRLHPAYTTHSVPAGRLSDLTPTQMNDIKEYFTANKHPLISRSARINQRLQATMGPERPRCTTTPRRRDHGSGRVGRQLQRRADGRWCQLSRQRQERRVRLLVLPARRSYTKFNQRSTVLARRRRV